MLESTVKSPPWLCSHYLVWVLRRLRGFKTILLRTLHIVILKSLQTPRESSLTCWWVADMEKVHRLPSWPSRGQLIRQSLAASPPPPLPHPGYRYMHEPADLYMSKKFTVGSKYWGDCSHSRSWIKLAQGTNTGTANFLLIPYLIEALESPRAHFSCVVVWGKVLQWFYLQPLPWQTIRGYD